MAWMEAAWLGVLQGLSEFLPVSSSGHLVMAAALLGRAREDILFEIAVHAGSLFAILCYYRARIAGLALGCLRREPRALGYAARLALASAPAALLGLLLRPQVESVFAAPGVAGALLFLTGAMLLSTRWTLPRARAAMPSFGQALLIGLAQSLALLPGVSRSGATVVMALAVGVAPLAASEFSFLLGAIAIAGAAALSLPEIAAAPPARLLDLGIGAACALLAGLAALWLFVRLLRARRFHHFAWYCFAAAALFLGWLALQPR